MNQLKAVKNHVYRNRAKYAVAATVVVCGYLHRKQVDHMNVFLDANGLMEKYYCPED